MKRVSSGSPYEKTIGFSRALRAGDYIYVSGTAPIAPDGTTAHPGDAYKQTIRCLEIIKKAIEDAGGSLEQVVRTRMYLVDTSSAEEVGRAHGEFFKDIRPASTMLAVKELLRKDWLIEIEADCTVISD